MTPLIKLCTNTPAGRLAASTVLLRTNNNYTDIPMEYNLLIKSYTNMLIG